MNGRPGREPFTITRAVTTVTWRAPGEDAGSWRFADFSDPGDAQTFAEGIATHANVEGDSVTVQLHTDTIYP